MKRIRLLKKILSSILLLVFNINIFGNVVLDPNSKYNTSLDSSQTGVPIVNISTPNSRGISVNDFLEYNVGKEGQVLNNADNVGRSYLAGLINSNPNLSANQAASLIVLQVNGVNRSNIEGYIEALSREKANIILSNENGIYLNGAGTINIKNFLPTTGKVKLQNGDYVGIDVSRGTVIIGEKGFDGTNTDYVDIISKTLELHGNVVGTDLRVVTGTNEVSKDGKITKKQGTPATVAIDGSQLGGMYAGQIKIIATDKGAGVNNKAFIVSKDSQLKISADGKVSVNKVQGQGINIVGTDYEQTDMAYSDKGINIKGNTITLSGTGTQANENINLDGNVVNSGQIYTKGELNTKDLVTNGDVQVTGNINVNGLLNNLGNVQGSNKLNVLNNGINSGTLQILDRVTFGGNLTNSGNILTNENIVAQNTTNSGNIIGKNITLGNVTNTNTGKIQTTETLNVGNVLNNGKILSVGTITGKNVDNSGKILSNNEINVKDIKNTQTIQAVKNITADEINNSGEISTNDNIKINGSLDNDTNATIEGKDVEVQGNHLNNKGKISVDNISSTVTTTTNDGKILSVNDIELKTQNLVNSGEILAGNDIKANNTNLNNSGKIASNNSISLENSGINNSSTGEVLSDNINMSNATSFVNNGKISGGETKLTTSGNLNLVGTLHGQRKLTIEANDIENNGKTTSAGTISIKSRDFKNNEELSADTILIDTSGDIVNNDMITGNQGDIKGNDIENNDLIATDNVLLLEAKNKLTNTSGNTIYGGKLQIKSNEILNEKQGGILGGSLVNINTSTLRNEVGTIQSSGDIFIKANKVENTGEVTDLDKYEKYYVTWDGIRLSESDIKTWEYFEDPGAAVSKHSDDSKNQMRNWLKRMKEQEKIKGYKSLIFTKYPNLGFDFYNRVGKEGEEINWTETPVIPEWSLKGKLKSNAKTEYGKILASRDIEIDSKDVKNKDGIISGGGTVSIVSTNLENSVTTGNAVQLNDGKEGLRVRFRRGSKRASSNAWYKRELVLGGIGYESGQPSVIEGNKVIVNSSNIITQAIPEAQGVVITGNNNLGNGLKTIFGKTINRGQTNVFNPVKVVSNGQKDMIASNLTPIQNIINTGTLTVNPVMTSAMFTRNVNPSSKYLLETRSKYINLSSYYGSDYFLTKIGYTPAWNRVRRLGDAYYENQLLTRAIVEKLGTAFINRKSNEQLIKDLIDNAGLEASRLGLKLGEELTPEQINNLSRDLVWYVVKEVNGVEVLVPQIYFSKVTLSTLLVDGRNKIGGTDYTYVQSENLENNGTKIGNRGTTIVDVKSLKNETVTNQLSEITGDKTYIISDKNIENIGGSINGSNEVSLISLDGDIVNISTKNNVQYNNGELDRSSNETIASIGEIKSTGTTNIEGKNYTSVGASTLGEKVVIKAEENVNIEVLKLTGKSKFGSDSENYNSASRIENLGSTVQGTRGVSITTGKDINISGSEVVSNGNVIVTGENINITNAINSLSTESKFKNKKTF